MKNKSESQNFLTIQEWDSLIQAIKYNDGKIFVSCVNEKIVNSLCKKGFTKLAGNTAIATKNVMKLFEIEGERAFDEIVVCGL